MRPRPRLIFFAASTALASIGALIACGSDDSSPVDTGGGDSGSDTSTTTDSAKPGDSGTDAGATAPTLIAGGQNACLITTSGMKCWGDNRYGTLGIGTDDSTPHFTPTAVPGISPTAASLNEHHACAIASGQVFCWGDNIIGELGHDPAIDLDASTSTCLGSYPCAKSPTPVSGISSPAQIASGTFHSCVLRSDGTLSCWGDNRYGEVGELTPDSGPFCSGNKCEPTPHDVSGITTGARVAAGEDFECVLGTTATGLSLSCLGSDVSNDLGRSAIPMGDLLPHPDPAAVDGLTNPIQFAISFDTVCALMADHSVSCWGNDTQAQVGVDPASAPTTCDGDPCALTPQTVAGISNAREVAGGGAFCAIKSDDTVWCWGPNGFGQLGHDPFTDDASASFMSPTPRQVAGIGPADHIAVGADFACALLKDGSVWCWGNNEAGQLGAVTNDVDGAPVQFTYKPVQVTGL